MQGMVFVILDKDGQVVNQGTIAEKITSKKYLCQFFRPATAFRVIPLEDIQTYTLFAKVEQMTAFITAIRPATPEKKISKKKSKKKVRKSK